MGLSCSCPRVRDCWRRRWRVPLVLGEELLRKYRREEWRGWGEPFRSLPYPNWKICYRLINSLEIHSMWSRSSTAQVPGRRDRFSRLTFYWWLDLPRKTKILSKWLSDKELGNVTQDFNSYFWTLRIILGRQFVKPRWGLQQIANKALMRDSGSEILALARHEELTGMRGNW